jgi:ribose transport system permease protein
MTATLPPPSLPTQSRHRPWRASVIDHLGLLAVLAILIASFGLTTRYFFTLTTFSTLANQIPSTVLVAVGMTYVLIIGGIDLSVGSVLGLSAAVIGILMTGNHPAPLAIAAIAALLTGLLCGAINGLITVIWPVPSFVVTLGMLEIARGAAFLLTSSRTRYIGTPAATIADISLLGLSLPFYIAIATVLLAQLTLTRTVFGRYMIAIGTNEEAVRLSGIATAPVKLAVFMIASFLAAGGAILDVSRSQAATPNAGTGLELDVIAAVVIGGTSLMGGRGSVIKSLLGVAIIGVLSAGLAAHDVQDQTKRLITGCVIILAVILDHYRHRLTRNENQM